MQKLLLVEDDPNLQLTILTALEAQGYTVDAASTTGEAIERLNENSYPVVLTDIYIDERTGLDVLGCRQAQGPAVRGHPDDGTRERGDGHGGDQGRGIRIYRQAF